jgi:hypothetical protein
MEMIRINRIADFVPHEPLNLHCMGEEQGKL